MNLQKTFALGISLIFGLIAISMATLYLFIGSDVKSNIETAQAKYGGEAEDALISFLQDQTNTFYDRTYLAVWTLGHIRSEKAYELLRSYYKNDPKGITFYGKHQHMLCQYELHKALQAIENRQLFSYAALKAK